MDTNVDFAPDFGRYAAAIRRRWVWIVALAVLVGLAVAVTRPVTTKTTNVRFLVNDMHRPDGSSTGLFGYESPQVSVEDQAAYLGQAAKDAHLLRLTMTVAPSGENFGTITFESTDARDVVVSASDKYIDLLDSYRLAILTEAAKPALEVAASQIKDVDASIAQIDKSIDSLSEAAAVSATNARATLVAARTTYVLEQTLLQGLPASEHGVVKVSTVVDESSSIPRVILAALGGGILALLVVVVMAALDRRVRRRADVERALGANSLIGVLPSSPNDVDLGALGATIRRLSSAGTVQLVGVRGVDTGPLSDSVRPYMADGNEAAVRGWAGLDSGSAPLLEAGTGVFVLVVPAGQITEDELAQAQFLISGAGGHLAGAVLTDVRASVAKTVR